MIIERIAAAALGALVLMLSACHSGGDDVEKRAMERWNYLIAKQSDKAYDFLSPGTRETQTREAYAAASNNRPLKWTAVKFNRKECDTDRCKVYVDVSYSLTMPGMAGASKPTTATSTQQETWVHVDDAWYFLPK
jgi:hypothetical protein